MHAHATPRNQRRAHEARHADWPIPLLEDWRASESAEDLARWTGQARLVAIAAAAVLSAAVLIAGG
jgi:hypothetical protein